MAASIRWIRPGAVGILTVTYGEPPNEGVDTYPIVSTKPVQLTSVGPIYDVDTWRIATGTRNLNGVDRGVAWPVTDEEAEEINQLFIDAIKESSAQVFFADEDS